MIIPRIDERPVLEVALPANMTSGEVEAVLVAVLREQERIRQARTPVRLIEAVHRLRHEKGALWPPTDGCGCYEFATELRNSLG